MDLRKLKTLIDLVSESGISELEVTEGEGKVRIVKNAPPVYVQQAPTQYAQPHMGMAPAAAPLAGAEVPAAALAPAVVAGHVVKSPMVGTFYRAPSRAPRHSCKSATPSRKARPFALSKR